MLYSRLHANLVHDAFERGEVFLAQGAGVGQLQQTHGMWSDWRVMSDAPRQPGNSSAEGEFYRLTS